MRNNNVRQLNGKKTSALNEHQPLIGILEWFRINDYAHVKRATEEMKKMGITHLRTGVSWADYHLKEGQDWYDWLMPYLSSNFDILPCFLYTPPSIGRMKKTSSPPKDPKAFADFLDLFINRHGKHFGYVELWNEPNNVSEYDYRLDESWNVFADMINKAAYWATRLGKKTVLGGLSPVDPNWIKMMAQRGVLNDIDVVGIHGFPGIFDFHWNGWNKNIDIVDQLLKKYGSKAEIWITETGYSTWRYDERKQIENLLEVSRLPVNRIYWYSLTDVPLSLPTVDGRHSDEREYHFGMINENGNSKLLHRLWSMGGIENVQRNEWLVSTVPKGIRHSKSRVLVTGGAGFIGTNLSHRLLSEGHHVTILDNLSRPGVENNLKWQKDQHGAKLDAVIADTRDQHTVEQVVGQADHIFHFAAQVAVTTSLTNPVHDFEVNVKGTINILEAIRRSSHKPSLIYTSTNKVYGNLNDIGLTDNGIRYSPKDELTRDHGISERRPLDFHSPYGSSKGAADQYILDYSRSYGLRNIVFRMSCIYGPHQFGTEDQGWVAHFLLKALKNEKIILYGDGMQVRDLLFVDDLVEAFMKAWSKTDVLRGEAFNIGGGPENSVSLMELISLLEAKGGTAVPVSFENWRPGDQKYYVSDTGKFRQATGWAPEISAPDGVSMLYTWLKQFRLNGHLKKSPAIAEIIR